MSSSLRLVLMQKIYDQMTCETKGHISLRDIAALCTKQPKGQNSLKDIIRLRDITA